MANYINNADFLVALIDYRNKYQEYKTKGSKEPNIPNYIGECFLMIARHLATKPNFTNYSFKEEMISDGVENSLMYFRNFNPEKGKNPFAYFTQIIYYAFLRRILKEKKQLYVKYKAAALFGVMAEGEMYEDVDGNMKAYVMYDNISEFIQTFEDAKKKKKKTSKLKGLEKFIDEDITEVVNEVIDEVVDDIDIEEDELNA